MSFWYPLPGHPGYEMRADGAIRGARGLIKPFANSHGHLCVNLYQDGELRRWRVSVLLKLLTDSLAHGSLPEVTTESSQ